MGAARVNSSEKEWLAVPADSGEKLGRAAIANGVSLG